MSSSLLNPTIRYYAEQGGIMVAMKKNKACADSVVFVPQKILNAYYEGGCGSSRREGDFILHFPGNREAKAAFRGYLYGESKNISSTKRRSNISKTTIWH